MIINIFEFEGSSKVFNKAFDASSVSDFVGGNINILYLASIGKMLSLVITFLISSTPNVLIFSDVTTLISGCSRMSLELNNKWDEKAFAWSIK